jgi:hypothetical protein
MIDRRNFLKSVVSAAALGTVAAAVAPSDAVASASGPDDSDERRYWLSVVQRLAGPVLGSLAKRELRKAMPVETTVGATNRDKYTHLEAFGRLLAGISPWLGLSGLTGDEAGMQRRFVALAHQSLDAATDPRSPDFLNFCGIGQPLVDTAFLAQGILRAPTVLWDPLEARVKGQIVDALKSSRAIPRPKGNNWVMFAAMVEAALLRMGEPTIPDRLEDCLRSMLSWYKGDGAYGDGEWFHADYYNSFVIHPMLVDVVGVLSRSDRRFEPAMGTVLERARRYAVIQERLIAPDGTFPSLGRSTTYRFGAFQLLAQVCLMGQLPGSIGPAQVRCALTKVIGRMIEAPGTFDDGGWLRIGFCGHQPTLAEAYISTGSLYLCSAALLPLGLPSSTAFWSGQKAPWTSQRLWSGESLPADHAMVDHLAVEIPDLARTENNEKL